MKTQTYFSLKLNERILTFGLFALLTTLILSFIFVPHFTSRSFASEGYDVQTNAVTLTLSPVDTTKSDYRMVFSNRTSDGNFGTVGINANVSTANTFGYSLYMRSSEPASRFLYKDMDFAASGNYIGTLSAPVTVTTAGGSGFSEINKYGWSTDWNPATSRGTFNPMSNTDITIRQSVKETYKEGEAVAGEDTKVYIGAMLNDQVLSGTYKGTIVFTAVTNNSHVLGEYTLNYDLNGGTAPDGTFPTQTATATVESPTVNFTINTAAPTHPTPDGNSSYRFLGWSIDRNSTSPEFEYTDGVVSPASFSPSSTNTTLYAIWQKPMTLAAHYNYTYNLIYNSNGGTGGPSNARKNSNSDTESIPVNTRIPTKEGSEFLGYAYNQSATTPDFVYKKSDNTFTPASVSFTASVATTKTIYAVWKNTTTTFEQAFQSAGVATYGETGYYAMQDITPEICSAVTTAPADKLESVQTIQLIDTRDSKVYTVAKLADGNCWMTENLRLGSANSSTTLTASDSDVSSSFVLPAHSSNWSASYSEPMVHVSDDQSVGSFVGFYGYYYNYNAATAGTVGEEQKTATSSICAKGWQLPSAFNTLITAYGATSADAFAKLSAAPFNFVTAGSHNSSGSSINSRGTKGYYWTNNSESAINASSLVLDTNNTSQNGHNKENGNTIRCVVRNNSSQNSNTTPLGETISETDNGTAALIAVGVGTAVTASSFLILFLAKRRKEEEEELNVE